MPTWKPIKGYEGLYAISSDGEVKNVKRGVLVEPQPNSAGYLQVTLSKRDGNKKCYVQRLVREHFGKSLGKNQAHHKNNNKLDNKASNVVGISQQDNIKEEFGRRALMKARRGNK
jgi:hypothetical protein